MTSLQHAAAPRSAIAEWKSYWTLPIAGALGYATSVIHIYGLGPYISPVSEAFGWSRTQTTGGLTVATLLAAALSIPVGMAVDRYGSRWLGIAGVILLSLAFGLLGTATGTSANWYLLWIFVAFSGVMIQATVWTSAVATRFSASRGMAFALTLCGASVASAVFPVLGTLLVKHYGWRSAFAWHAGLWLVLALPVILLFFRGARDGGGKTQSAPTAPDALTGVPLKEGYRSSVFIRLAFASLLFTFTILALMVHFIPILTDRGANAMSAAGIASLIGLFSIVGRFGTGFLLDRFPASRVGAAVFLLPVLGVALMLTAGGSPLALSLAAALIGLTLGAEVDVIAFLTTQHFGLKNFGGFYGGLLVALSSGTATGPITAAKVFDATGSYTGFLGLSIATMLAASLAIFSLPKPGALLTRAAPAP